MITLSTILQHKCPNCGAGVEFDVGVQKLKCPFCDSELEIPAQDNDDYVSTVEESVNWNSGNAGWSNGETDGMSVYVCKSCGGEIIADKTTGASICPYCDNPVVMKGQFSGALKPDLVIPFKFDKKAAKEALLRHVSSKKFIPQAFKDENHIDEIKGVYVPHWLFTCDALAEVQFSAQRISTWSDRNYIYTKTSYYNLYRSGSIGFDNVPVDGSTKMADELMESVEPFNISDAVSFNTAYLSGYLADKYDVSAEVSMARATERIRQSAADTFRQTVQNYVNVNTTNVNMNVANGICRYALYPVWLLNTTWNGNRYTFAMNGQTGKIVGDVPTDKKAVRKVGLLLGLGLSALFCGISCLVALF
jgi:DNA-directed RNA polymerase subunit RPC12/RpoP